MVRRAGQRFGDSARQSPPDEDHAGHGPRDASRRKSGNVAGGNWPISTWLSRSPTIRPITSVISPVDRLLETIERFEEDLTDQVRVHGHLKAVIEVGPPIPVSPERDRRAAVDPLMVEIERQLQGMLDRLASESRLYHAPGDAPTAS